MKRGSQTSPASSPRVVYVSVACRARAAAGSERALARALVTRARAAATDRSRDSPFSLAAKDADILWRSGGRADADEDEDKSSERAGEAEGVEALRVSAGANEVWVTEVCILVARTEGAFDLCIFQTATKPLTG